MVIAFVQIKKPNIFFRQVTKANSEFDELVFSPHYFWIHTGLKQFYGVAIPPYYSNALKVHVD